MQPQVGCRQCLLCVLSGLAAGDHVVSSSSIFGASKVLLSGLLGKFGVSVDFVELTDLSAWESVIRKDTAMVFFETPTNPLMEVGDIEKISNIAHAKNEACLVVVDNCFCTPILQKPLSLGADVVLHSATKFIDGQGRCVGGAIVGTQEFVGEKVLAYMRTAGPSL